jgi:hypothetical protein
MGLLKGRRKMRLLTRMTTMRKMKKKWDLTRKRLLRMKGRLGNLRGKARLEQGRIVFS